MGSIPKTLYLLLWISLYQQGGNERKAGAYKESGGGRAWAGANAREKITGISSFSRAHDCYAEADAYAGAAAYKSGDHDALKESIGVYMVSEYRSV